MAMNFKDLSFLLAFAKAKGMLSASFLEVFQKASNFLEEASLYYECTEKEVMESYLGNLNRNFNELPVRKVADIPLPEEVIGLEVSYGNSTTFFRFYMAEDSLVEIPLWRLDRVFRRKVGQWVKYSKSSYFYIRGYFKLIYSPGHLKVYKIIRPEWCYGRCPYVRPMRTDF